MTFRRVGEDNTGLNTLYFSPKGGDIVRFPFLLVFNLIEYTNEPR